MENNIHALAVFDGEDFVGLEFSLDGKSYCVYNNQRIMPGIRIGSFAARYDRPLHRREVTALQRGESHDGGEVS